MEQIGYSVDSVELVGLVGVEFELHRVYDLLRGFISSSSHRRGLFWMYSSMRS